MFYAFVLLSIFPVSYTVCLGVFVLKKLITLSLKSLTIFPINSGI